MKSKTKINQQGFYFFHVRLLFHGCLNYYYFFLPVFFPHNFFCFAQNIYKATHKVVGSLGEADSRRESGELNNSYQ